MYRTCSEARAADPSLTMGMHWIDPDGQGVGDDPIFVYCDMATGKTAVLHDSEDAIDVGYCTDPGCYSREIVYTATMRQMTTLAELSKECHQSIKYECYDAPLERMESFTVGGMTEMEIHNISGPETTQAFTPVSAESIENASILMLNAIVMQLLHIS
ncbi:contactin-associated protein-like 2 [Daphnia pulex]|uniref:contactin-associated protein-like 2 n=1 Tax=Daphnia pulex TaxID=6669 RepID=UPI001EE0A30C|nr:contactin-associated protein-like 2 [Daphnia pulex]